MEFSNWLDRGSAVVENWNDSRFDHLQAFVENRGQFQVTIEDSRVDEIERGQEMGLGLTAVEGRNTHFSSFSSVETFSRETDQLSNSLDIDSENIDWQDPEEKDWEIHSPPSLQPDSEKMDRLLEADRVARDWDKRIQQVNIRYRERTRTIAVIDREGWIRTEPQVLTNLNVTAIAVEEGRREKGYGRLAGYTGEDLFDEKSPSEMAEKASRQAVTSLEAQSVKAGPTTVVIGAGFGGTIFHEACGHGFEADHIFEDVSTYAGRMGEEVASSLVTFVDDGSIPGKYGSSLIDDEGTETGRNVLIEKGVMRSLMTDRKHAELLDISPTGNGRRQSFRYPVLPRMTNTFIEAGMDSPDDLIENTEDGIYAKEIGGGQVDPASGDFIFSISEGFRIENGEVIHPIRDAALVGNGPEVLKRIDGVADDLKLTPGVCGKGQWVPVCVGQPTLRVQELTVGGDQ